MLDKLRKTITSVLSHIEIQQENTSDKEIFDKPTEIHNKKSLEIQYVLATLEKNINIAVVSTKDNDKYKLKCNSSIV